MAGRKQEEGLQDLTLLGNQKTRYPADYDPGVLEAVDNLHADRDYFVKFNCPEFTSLCPLTGQPDFATMYISYIPDKKNCRKQISETVSFQFPQPWRFS